MNQQHLHHRISRGGHAGSAGQPVPLLRKPSKKVSRWRSISALVVVSSTAVFVIVGHLQRPTLQRPTRGFRPQHPREATAPSAASNATGHASPSPTRVPTASRDGGRTKPRAVYSWPDDADRRLDAFLRSYLRSECLRLDNCSSVRDADGYSSLTQHQQGQAVMTRVLRAFSLLFEELGVPWIVLAGTLLGVLRHGGWIPWDHDLDILMSAADTHRVARELHRLPPDLTMVHPLVDGATMGRGIYGGLCTSNASFGFDPESGEPTTDRCDGVAERAKLTGCLYSSLRDINSCRPMTSNIMNGLSVDIFVTPRECGHPEPRCKSFLHNTTTAPFHGWAVPVPVDPHPLLSGGQYDKDYERVKGSGDYMTIPQRRPRNEFEDALDPDRICANWENVTHPQSLVRNGTMFVRRDGARSGNAR